VISRPERGLGQGFPNPGRDCEAALVEIASGSGVRLDGVKIDEEGDTEDPGGLVSWGAGSHGHCFMKDA
jgi:hypothetical protein